MAQKMTALLFGIRGVDILPYRNDDGDFLWDDDLDDELDRPVVSVNGEAVGFVVAVGGYGREGEGDLSDLVMSLGDAQVEVAQAFPDALAMARTRWDQLAKLLAAQGITLETPMLLLAQIERG